MKKTQRKLIPAVAMLLISAIMLSTSSFAWFSMNTTVTATNMKVTAEAEVGLLISNAASSGFGVSANTTAKAATLKPISTADMATWYHSQSNTQNAATSNGTYTSMTELADSAALNAYRTLNTFYLRSSGATALPVASLDIKDVTVVGASQDLSDSLRVAIKIGNKVVIYAPVTGASVAAYNVNGSISVIPIATGTETKVTRDQSGIVQLPNNATNGQEVTIAVFFEGEDANCMSKNVVESLEQLTVTVTFGFTE